MTLSGIFFRGCWRWLAKVGLCLIAGFFSAKVRAAELTASPAIRVVEPRIWSCDFPSQALGREMRFLVILPEQATLQSAPQPVIYFLHGLGRNETTLLADEECRRALLARQCAMVLPRGLEGWYINSPVNPADRYADYVDEVIAVAGRNFPLRHDQAGQAIGGWSMGGYGSAYTACRRPGEFCALATIIGIIDFPRLDIEPADQNFLVPPRFGTDPELWRTLNPRLRLAALKSTAIYVAYADAAAERQMNEAFIADAQQRNFSIQSQRIAGGHVFPVVREALRPALDFLETQLRGKTP